MFTAKSVIALCRPLVLAVFGSLVSLPAQAQEDYLSMKFSKKSQVKTSMRWMGTYADVLGLHEGEEVDRLKDGVIVTSGQPADAGGDTKESSDPIPLYEKLPYGAIGKLFFAKHDGSISTCTASFAGSTDVLITAAHCVISTDGDWNRDFLFVRSYGSANQTAFAITCAATDGLWGERLDSSALEFDYAFLKTGTQNPLGKLNVNLTELPEVVSLIGYANKYYRGRYILRLDVPTFPDERGLFGSRNNPMGSGSSGTPWLKGTQLYSVSSHFREEQQDTMWGPQLTNSALELMHYARNGCERG